MHQAQGNVDPRKSAVEGICLFTPTFGHFGERVFLLCLVLAPVRFTKPGERQRILGIKIDGRLKMADCGVKIGDDVVPLEIAKANEVFLICLGNGRLPRGNDAFRLGIQFNVQHFQHLRDGSILQAREVRLLDIEHRGTELTEISCVDEVQRQTEDIIKHLEIAGDDKVGAKQLIGFSGTSRLVLPYFAGWDNPKRSVKLLKLCQLAGNRLDKTVTKRLLRRVGADACKRQNGQVLFVGNIAEPQPSLYPMRTDDQREQKKGQNDHSRCCKKRIGADRPLRSPEES